MPEISGMRHTSSVVESELPQEVEAPSQESGEENSQDAVSEKAKWTGKRDTSRLQASRQREDDGSLLKHSVTNSASKEGDGVERRDTSRLQASRQRESDGSLKMPEPREGGGGAEGSTSSNQKEVADKPGWLGKRSESSSSLSSSEGVSEKPLCGKKAKVWHFLGLGALGKSEASEKTTTSEKSAPVRTGAAFVFGDGKFPVKFAQRVEADFKQTVEKELALLEKNPEKDVQPTFLSDCRRVPFEMGSSVCSVGAESDAVDKLRELSGGDSKMTRVLSSLCSQRIIGFVQCELGASGINPNGNMVSSRYGVESLGSSEAGECSFRVFGESEQVIKGFNLKDPSKGMKLVEMGKKDGEAILKTSISVIVSQSGDGKVFVSLDSNRCLFHASNVSSKMEKAVQKQMGNASAFE